MNHFNLITEVESAVEEIAISRAVLEQAMEFFDSTNEEDLALLPYYAETIHRLLIASDILLCNLADELSNCFKTAEKCYLEERNGTVY